MAYIYGLKCTCHPGTGVRYIGQTKRNIPQRLREHLKPSSRRRQHPVHRWIDKHEAQIEAVVLEECSTGDLDDREKFWIRNSSGLLNVTPGGSGERATATSEEVKAKIASSLRDYYRTHDAPMKGRVMSEESRLKMSTKAKARVVSDETKEKLSRVFTGREVSPGTRALLSELNKGDRNPAYGSVGYWKGKTRTDETKRRISLKNSGEGSVQAKLTREQVVVIKKMIRDGTTCRIIAETFGVATPTIYTIKQGRSWKSVE